MTAENLVRPRPELGHENPFNEAAADDRGKPEKAVVTWWPEAVPSMRPRPMTAENRPAPCSSTVTKRPSMRPRPMTAENRTAGNGRHVDARAPSMRPRPMTAENRAAAPRRRPDRPPFNEAAADDRGKP